MIFPKKTFISLLSTATLTNASGYSVGDNWSTLSPTDGYLAGATTEFAQSFGIAINPVVSSVSLTSGTKTFDSPVITQIGDGQIQATTETSVRSRPIITQIGDGQIQASASADDSTTIYTVFSTTVEKKYVTIEYTGETESSFTLSSSSLLSSSASTSSRSNFSEDITTTYTIIPTTLVVVTLTSPTLPVITTTPAQFTKRGLPQSCVSSEALAMTLSNGILKDSKGRVGSIVANRQFQFDGPPPQAGAIYAAGWSIMDGKLALGRETIFYQCLSGNFYNLYDESIGEQCVAVELDVIALVDC